MKKHTLLLAILTIVISTACPGPEENPTESPTPPGLTPSPTPVPTVTAIPAPPVVTGVIAGRLQFTDRIRITWTAVPAAASYLVYRYTNKTENYLDGTFAAGTNVYDDISGSANGALPSTPYFYKIACIVNGQTANKSANFVPGLYGSLLDELEPNDDQSQAAEANNIGDDVCLFSYGQGTLQDTDWYKYTGSESILNVVITLPTGSPLAGIATLEIANNSSSCVLAVGSNTLPYVGTEDLYFSVFFTIPDPAFDAIAPYNVLLQY